MIRNDWGMMHDKFSDHLIPARFHELISLAQHRIERLLHGSLKVVRLHHAVHGEVGESLCLIWLLDCLI